MKIFFSSLLFSISLLMPALALAHSTVTPSQTSTSKYETFTLSVPVEKDAPTVAIKLIIPDGVDHVMPIVKPGWKVAVQKDGDRVTEIAWTGGSIPAEQKDMFQFSARTASTPTKLVWKVYQTYQGGEIVAWDRDPSSPKDGEEKMANPYSTTDVEAVTAAPAARSDSSQRIAYAALAISCVALVFSIRKRS